MKICQLPIQSGTITEMLVSVFCHRIKIISYPNLLLYRRLKAHVAQQRRHTTYKVSISLFEEKLKILVEEAKDQGVD